MDGEDTKLSGRARLRAPADHSEGLPARAHRRAEVPRSRASGRTARAEDAGGPDEQASGSPRVLREGAPLRGSPGAGERRAPLAVPLSGADPTHARTSGASRHRPDARVLRPGDPGRRLARGMVGSSVSGDPRRRGPRSRAQPDGSILGRGSFGEGRKATSGARATCREERPAEGDDRHGPGRTGLPADVRRATVPHHGLLAQSRSRVRAPPPATGLVHPVRPSGRSSRGGRAKLGRAPEPRDHAGIRGPGPADRGPSRARSWGVPRGGLNHAPGGRKGQTSSREPGKGPFLGGTHGVPSGGRVRPRGSRVGRGPRAIPAHAAFMLK